MREILKQYNFTERELDVLREIVQLRTNNQIAEKLRICEKTVEFHARNIYHKLKVKGRIETILWFAQNVKN